MTNVPTVSLNNGVSIPQLGFGVWQVPPAETETAVAEALRVGYRSIDTAALYQNEAGVGAAIKASGIPRDQLFVTTKLGNPDQGYDSTLKAFDTSIALLGLDYVDLYLIHWPRPAVDRYIDTWRAFEQIHADGRVRAVGVSNFQIPHLERVLESSGLKPTVNQIELHPFLSQLALREFHAEHSIATEAWSPLAQGGELLQHPTITTIAQHRGMTAAQVVLSWHLAIGNIAIPKSVTPARIAENLDAVGHTLTADEIAEINGLNRDERTGPDPETLN
jgi:2,5-diketo-D-gluconate reductase A